MVARCALPVRRSRTRSCWTGARGAGPALHHRGQQVGPDCSGARPSNPAPAVLKLDSCPLHRRCISSSARHGSGVRRAHAVPPCAPLEAGLIAAPSERAELTPTLEPGASFSTSPPAPVFARPGAIKCFTRHQGGPQNPARGHVNHTQSQTACLPVPEVLTRALSPMWFAKTYDCSPTPGGSSKYLTTPNPIRAVDNERREARLCPGRPRGGAAGGRSGAV